MKSVVFVRNTPVLGKWNNSQFRIEKKLGQGGVASVYLAYDIKHKTYYALKISQDNLALNREYEMLKQFSASNWVVRTYGIDDWEYGGKLYHFLVLEYIAGTDLKTYVQAHQPSPSLIMGMLLMLTKALGQFEQMGYMLGDFKLENIMVDDSQKKLRLIDLGGVVKIGETIKEYTPAYDRASWKCGSRCAHRSYQQFSLVMMAARLFLRENLDPYGMTREQLIQKIKALPVSPQVIEFLKSTIEQKNSSEKFVNQIHEIYNIERRYEMEQKKNRRDGKINGFFIGSFGLMTVVYLLILIERYFTY